MSAPPAFGSYHVLHQTGSGVQGPVFRAFDSTRDRLVAIKAFAFDLTPERVVRLADALRERAASPVGVARLVPIIDAGIEGTTPFIVMECQTDETLDVVMRRLAPLPVEPAVAILTAMAEAIDGAAAIGLAHGALHPRDIFVTPELDDVRMTGFGVAQALHSVGLERVVRRPYSVPERDGAQSDRHALGVIAHELLTGTRPSDHGEQSGQFAGTAAPEQRAQLRHVLATALSARAEDGFQTGQDFVAALAAAARRERAIPQSQSAPVPFPSHEVIWRRDDAPTIEVASSEALSPAVAMEDEPAGRPAESIPHPLDSDVLRRPVTVLSLAAPKRSFASGRRAIAMAAMAVVALAGGSGLAFLVHGRTQVGGARESESANVADIVGHDIALSQPAAPVVAAGSDSSERITSERPAESQPGSPVVPHAATLTVRSDPPGALVTIDGHLSGETPAVLRDLAPGTYTVRVARPGHIPREQRVTLGSTARARTLLFTLERGLDAPAVSVGALDVDSRPRGARVRVDGRLLGPAPLRVSALRPGVHDVTLELDGYRPAERRMDIAPGAPSILKLTLRSLVP